MNRAVAVDFDAVFGDTKPLWHAWITDAERRYRVELDEGMDDATLDARLGNWRALVERFADDHAPVYLRPHPEANAAVRRLHAAGVRVGAFTDSPEPLVGVAASHLGVARRLDVLESGPGALDRVLARLGPTTPIVRTVADLVETAMSGV